MHTNNYRTFPVDNINQLKIKMLNWVKQFNIFCLLDDEQYKIAPHFYQYMLAVGDPLTTFTSLVEIDARAKDSWLFGHFSYDLKNLFHTLPVAKPDKVNFPELFFFEPEHLMIIQNDELKIYSDDAEEIYNEIENQPTSITSSFADIHVQQKLSHEEYVSKIKKLQNHILRGDCYEINFCQEFFSENTDADPAWLYYKLMQVSPNPFSAFYKLQDKFLVCASPERFLTNKNGRIYSQPIKGTAKRDNVDKSYDKELRQQLQLNQKERSENVMIVDLMRNDLSKICKKNSVSVDELFGVYSYPQVHQMISTISGELLNGIKFSEIISATFPMGSMTGAPKLRVMQLIDEYEVSARGIFSGSVGYIAPNGDFDFNVVIRSIMYNSSNRYLSYQVGSGITFYSDANREWEECLLKAKAIKKVLTNEQHLKD